MLQQSKVPQIQAAEGEVLLIYWKPLATLKMRHPRQAAGELKSKGGDSYNQGLIRISILYFFDPS
jgi:hypothetical protein